MIRDVPAVLVTGANRGMGFETCRQLGKLDWRVIVGSRDLAKGDSAVDRLDHERIVADCLWLDVADGRSIVAAARELKSLGIRLSALVNNAAVYFERTVWPSARTTMETNLLGPMRVTDAFSALMETGARIVNVTSGLGDLSGFPVPLRKRIESEIKDRAGLESLAGEYLRSVETGSAKQAGWPSAYAVSKAFLNAFTRLLARERPDWRVNSVCPGWVATDMGGPGAERTVSEGAAGIVFAATLRPSGPSGCNLRDARETPW